MCRLQNSAVASSVTFAAIYRVASVGRAAFWICDDTSLCCNAVLELEPEHFAWSRGHRIFYSEPNPETELRTSRAQTRRPLVWDPIRLGMIRASVP